MKKVFVVLESGLGGTPDKEPVAVFKGSSSSKKIFGAMKNLFGARHDPKCFGEKSQMSFIGKGVGSRFEIKEMVITSL